MARDREQPELVQLYRALLALALYIRRTVVLKVSPEGARMNPKLLRA